MAKIYDTKNRRNASAPPPTKFTEENIKKVLSALEIPALIVGIILFVSLMIWGVTSLVNHSSSHRAKMEAEKSSDTEGNTN